MDNNDYHKKSELHNSKKLEFTEWKFITEQMFNTNKLGNLNQSNKTFDSEILHRVKNPMHQETCA